MREGKKLEGTVMCGTFTVFWVLMSNSTYLAYVTQVSSCGQGLDRRDTRDL